MASLPSPPCCNKEAIHGADRNTCARAQAVTSSSGAAARLCKELRLSSFSQVRAFSVERSEPRLLQRVAARRTPQKRTPAVEENFEEDEAEYGEYVKPNLPGQERDFWEGPQFELLGFIIQYLWAIGIVVALVGCFLAVRFYNEGASDFRGTEVFKDAMESQGIVENPSDSKVFEEGSSQNAPSIEQERAS